MFCLLSLRWEECKITMFYIAQRSQIKPPTVSKILFRMLYPTDTKNKGSTCVLETPRTWLITLVSLLATRGHEALRYRNRDPPFSSNLPLT